MLAGRWVDGRTGPAIARAWGVSAHYMRKIAAEASRRVAEERLRIARDLWPLRKVGL